MPDQNADEGSRQGPSIATTRRGLGWGRKGVSFVRTAASSYSFAPILLVIFLFGAGFFFFFGGFGAGALPATTANDGSQTQAGQEGGTATCVANSGTCQSSCSQGYIADTSGATCTDDPSRPICCVPLPSCNGTCVTGIKCTNASDTIDTSATTCGAGSVCCVPPSSQPPIKFYCQYNTSWNYQNCNINSYGCTPTALAMILASYGTSFTPAQVSQAVLDPKYNQQIGCGGPLSKTGTSMDGARAAVSWTSSQGFTVANSLANGSGRPNLSLFRKYTSSGYYLFVGAVMPFKRSSSTSATNSSPDGHSVVIYDADPTAGTVSYYDPTWCSGGRNNIPIPQTINVAAITSWYYVYPIKK